MIWYQFLCLMANHPSWFSIKFQSHTHRRTELVPFNSVGVNRYGQKDRLADGFDQFVHLAAYATFPLTRETFCLAVDKDIKDHNSASLFWFG